MMPPSGSTRHDVDRRARFDQTPAAGQTFDRPGALSAEWPSGGRSHLRHGAALRRGQRSAKPCRRPGRRPRRRRSPGACDLRTRDGCAPLGGQVLRAMTERDRPFSTVSQLARGVDAQVPSAGCLVPRRDGMEGTAVRAHHPGGDDAAAASTRDRSLLDEASAQPLRSSCRAAPSARPQRRQRPGPARRATASIAVGEPSRRAAARARARRDARPRRGLDARWATVGESGGRSGRRRASRHPGTAQR